MKRDISITNQTDKKQYLYLTLILLISFFLWTIISYAGNLAFAQDFSWSYLIIKGIIVSVGGVGFYLTAAKYGTLIFEKYCKPILYVFTALLFIFTAFEYSLTHIEIPVLKRLIAYAYATLPFLEIITLCAMTVCLNGLLKGAFSPGKVGLILLSLIATMLLSEPLKLVFLIVLVCILFSRLKAKEDNSKVAILILSVFCVLLFSFLAYECVRGFNRLIPMLNDSFYMSWTSRDVWRNAKWFGTMNDLKSVGGSKTYFSILWMIGFLGIIPSVLIIAALLVLTAALLKTNGKERLTTPLGLLSIAYLCVRIFLALLANCGIFFTEFMTPMPFIIDSVAGIFGACWLLGVTKSK